MRQQTWGPPGPPVDRLTGMGFVAPPMAPSRIRPSTAPKRASSLSRALVSLSVDSVPGFSFSASVAVKCEVPEHAPACAVDEDEEQNEERARRAALLPRPALPL